MQLYLQNICQVRTSRSLGQGQGQGHRSQKVRLCVLSGLKISNALTQNVPFLVCLKAPMLTETPLQYAKTFSEHIGSYNPHRWENALLWRWGLLAPRFLQIPLFKNPKGRRLLRVNPFGLRTRPTPKEKVKGSYNKVVGSQEQIEHVCVSCL